MSVAEALGQQSHQRDLDVRRQQKYYTGLQLGDGGILGYESKPRVDEGHQGIQYGNREYDRGHPHPRPMNDPFSERTPDMDKVMKQRMDMDEDIQRMKERQMRDKMEREEEKKQNYDLLTKTFPWDQKSHGHGGPKGSGNNRRRKFLETDFSPRHQEGYKDKPEKQEYTISKKRETDLFLDTLGGPGGTVLRENGNPTLTDPRFAQQQSQFQQYKSPSPRQGGMTPKELDEYSRKLDQVSESKKIMKQQQRIQDLRNQIDHMKGETGSDDYPYRPQEFGRSHDIHRRSLDLENSKGGAGAPIKDPRGKNLTRMPITLRRDDFGESKITEDIPGKANFDLNFEDENKPYHPWGGQGGGAPIRDREGNVVTQIFGKLEGKDGPSVEARKNKRRQEVLYNELIEEFSEEREQLRWSYSLPDEDSSPLTMGFYEEFFLEEGMRQQKENKEELTRYMKAPQSELAEVLMAGRVGKPRRDEITGEIAQQHLPNSDVSKVKMNYQPKPITEKKRYHDELMRMAEERQNQKQLEKLKERQESNAHFQNMDSTWGSFGGGAPKHEMIRKKANLNNSLFHPGNSTSTQHFYDDNDRNPPTGLGSFDYQPPHVAYQKLYTEDDSRRYHSPDNSPRFVKSTINSSHKNMFESGENRRFVRAGNGNFAPYATGGIY